MDRGYRSERLLVVSAGVTLTCRAQLSLRPNLWWANSPHATTVSVGSDELLTGNVCVRAPQDGEFQCFCGEVYKSKRGLGQHKRHKHPAVLNTERLAVLPRGKSEWSDYDIRKLVNLTNAMMGSVSWEAVLYQKLAAMFPSRSAEGVKKRLIEVNISSDDIDVTVINVEQLEEERWRSQMLDNIINSLATFNEPRIRSTELLAIGRKVKFGRITNDVARSELETIVAECFPTKWNFQVRKTRAVRKNLSKIMIRRLNYVALQRLYHTRREDAANSITDGSWASMCKRELIYSLNMKDYWKKIFEMQSKRDNRPVAQNGHEWNIVAAFGSEEVRNALRDAVGTTPGVAFQKKDGCLEASTLLHTILRTVSDEAKPIAVAFLGISKVFASVSHDTLLRNAKSKIDGHGLGIPCLEITIPLEQRAKCERLVNSGTLEVANIVQCKAVVSDITVANVPIFVYGKPIGSKLEEEKAWREALVKTHDGADLMDVQVDRASFYWLLNPSFAVDCSPRRSGVVGATVGPRRTRVAVGSVDALNRLGMFYINVL
ncbi:hypothetical protein PHET_01016 [Paragonimus heterotremus]|uniref:Reverse transcriptase n=1 Tax=Paragonimus heterotremus TaxID=100268 RepID=A0A8J4TEF3_9TREM|nr:hypothetical protein PHET_01016 [Paragonimus heterotremus]